MAAAAQIPTSNPFGMSLPKANAKEPQPNGCFSRELFSRSYSNSSLADMSQMKLFACTLCYVRCRFEDLSEKDMFCEECLSNQLLFKCTYCRSEFRQYFELTNIVCSQCRQNEREFGKPISCQYCNLIAAFDGSKCDRCLKKEANYGPPMPCLECKRVAAFKRPEFSVSSNRLFAHNKKRKEPKPEGFCWLCAQSKPPTLIPASSVMPNVLSSLEKLKTEIVSPSPSIPKCSPKRVTCEDNLMESKYEMFKDGMQKRPRMMDNTAFNNDLFAQSGPSNLAETGCVSSFSALNQQQQRLSISSFLPTPSTLNMNSRFGSNILAEDQLATVIQLREEIHLLNKKIKDQDQKIIKLHSRKSKLRAAIGQEKRESIRKSHELQRQHSKQMDKLITKINTATTEIAKLKKTKPIMKESSIAKPPVRKAVATTSGGVTKKNVKCSKATSTSTEANVKLTRSVAKSMLAKKGNL